jgi:SAM-dependent MidA family methyltransferase
MSPTRTTFAQFMENALYGPQGYYASGRAQSGKKGDYFTAPDVSAVFGQLLAAIFQNWQKKTGIMPFCLVEAGAGEGALGWSILAQTDRTFFPYTAIERSPVRREKLASMGKVVADIGDILSFSGCLFANELLDAFPVHRVRIHQGKLQEAFVDDRSIVWDIPSTPQLERYLTRIGITLPEGNQTEINLAMADWFAQAAQKLERGFILLIDYGRPANEYYAPDRDKGTLRGFHQHQVVDLATQWRESAEGAGSFDITADIDFTSAALDARANGLEPLAFMEMGSFLLEAAGLLANRAVTARPSPVALQYLLHPEGLGAAFHVLVLGKNVALKADDFPHNRLHRLWKGTHA